MKSPVIIIGIGEMGGVFARGFVQPTVISVWFEKKKGRDVKVLIPSPAYGPAAGRQHRPRSDSDTGVTDRREVSGRQINQGDAGSLCW